MMNYWNQLKDREKLFLLGGSIVVMLYLVYILILNPLSYQVIKKERELQDKEELVIWMRDAMTLYQHSKKTQKISIAKLSSILSTELLQPPFNGYMFQIQQAQNNVLTISFNEVPFADTMVWLKKLTQRYQVKIDNIMAEKTQTLGRVKLSLTLKVD